MAAVVVFMNRPSDFERANANDLVALYPTLFPIHGRRPLLKSWQDRHAQLDQEDLITREIETELRAQSAAVQWLIESKRDGELDAIKPFGGLDKPSEGIYSVIGTGYVPIGLQPNPNDAITLQRMALAGDETLLVSRFELSAGQWLKLTGIHNLAPDDQGNLQVFLGDERLRRLRPIDVYALETPELAALQLRVPTADEWLQLYSQDGMPSQEEIARIRSLLDSAKRVFEQRNRNVLAREELVNLFRLLDAKDHSEDRDSLVADLVIELDIKPAEVEKTIGKLSQLDKQTVLNLIDHTVPIRKPASVNHTALVYLLGNLRELVDTRGAWPLHRDTSQRHPPRRFGIIGGCMWDKLDRTLFAPFPWPMTQHAPSTTLRLVRAN